MSRDAAATVEIVDDQPEPSAVEGSNGGVFVPRPPRTMADVGLSQNEIESLVLKFLLHVGSAAGRVIAD